MWRDMASATTLQPTRQVRRAELEGVGLPIQSRSQAEQPRGVLLLENEFEGVDVQELPAEIDTLSMIFNGDAFAIARSALDMSRLECWWRVSKRYNTSTPVSALNALMRIMALGRLKDHTDLLQWTSGTSCWRRFRRTTGDVAKTTKIAASLQVFPLDVADLVGQSTDGASQHEQVRDKVMAIVTNPSAMKDCPPPWSSVA